MKLKFTLLVVICITVLQSIQVAQAQNITTVAGGTSDRGEGVADTFGQVTPEQLLVDAAGNLYISDARNHVVKKVTASTRQINTVVGTYGTSGPHGDSGPATAANLDRPSSILIDGSGQMLIADVMNYRIRIVDASGMISTFSGLGTPGFSGDGVAASSTKIAPVCIAKDMAGNIYLTDSFSSRVRKISGGLITTIAGSSTAGFSGDGGAGTAAKVFNPRGICVSRTGDVFFADAGNNRIRKISPTGTITTVAGTGTAGYSGDGGPATSANIRVNSGLVTDTFNNLYFTNGTAIRKISPSGIISRFAGDASLTGYEGDGSAATAARMNTDRGLTIDPSGNLYLADHMNFVVRKISTSGVISTVAGNNFAFYTRDRDSAKNAVMSPFKLKFDTAGNLYFVDGYRQAIRKISPAGIVTRVAGSGRVGFSGDGGKATLADFGTYISVAPDRRGNIFITDPDNNRIRKVDATGIITTIAGGDSTGFSGDGGPASAAKLYSPGSIVTDTLGNIFFSDTYNARIRKIDTSGIITTVAGGASSATGDGVPATAAALSLCFYLAIDRNGNLFFSDYSNYIRKVSTAGIYTTIAGDGTAGYSGDGGPATAASIAQGSVDCDRAGNIWFAQSYYHTVRKIDTAGIITTYAGSGGSSYSGDGGPARLASFWFPLSVLTDMENNIYIGDLGNGRIRFICANDSIPTSISIAASDTDICYGSPVTFTSTVTGIGFAPVYTWMRNGFVISGAVSATYTSSSLATGDTISCILNGNNMAACAINNIDTSNKIGIFSHFPSSTPIVTAVKDSPDVVSFTGETITFTAVYTNGGTSPRFQWYKNGTAIPGATNNPYSSNAINNGDHISVTVWTNGICANPDSARSKDIAVGVTNNNSGCLPGISLYPNPNHGSFTISGSLPGNMECQMEIANALGETIYRESIAANNGVLNKTVSLGQSVMPGLYFIRLRSASGVGVYSFLVQ